MPADEAERWGLVSSVADDPGGMGRSFAAAMAGTSAEAVGIRKRLARQSTVDILPGRFADDLQQVNRRLSLRQPGLTMPG